MRDRSRRGWIAPPMPKLRFCGPKSEVSSDLAIVFFVAAGIAAVRFDLPDFGIVLPEG